MKVEIMEPQCYVGWIFLKKLSPASYFETHTQHFLHPQKTMFFFLTSEGC